MNERIIEAVLPVDNPHQLTDLAEKIHETAVDKGFWSAPEWMDKFQGKLMRVVTEIGEISTALDRDQGAAKVTEEFADVIIRMLDLYYVLVEEGEATYDLDDALKTKMAVNQKRPPLHGHRHG